MTVFVTLFEPNNVSSSYFSFLYYYDCQNHKTHDLHLHFSCTLAGTAKDNLSFYLFFIYWRLEYSIINALDQTLHLVVLLMWTKYFWTCFTTLLLAIIVSTVSERKCRRAFNFQKSAFIDVVSYFFPTVANKFVL